jgi:protoporphyrinogen/coproporphyrinogen III oxidase
MKRIAIIGGGISGLSAAYYLSKAGHDCTLIESEKQLGGVMRTERLHDCVIEAGPDSFLSQKPWALELIRELGIEVQLIGSNDHLRRTYVVRNGKLVPLPEGMQFLMPTKIAPILTTPLLSLGAKARMGLEYFRKPSATRADRSVADFVIDHYGREVNEYLAQPMVSGVYGGSPERLSINAVMPKIVELERRYGSVTRGVLASQSEASEANGHPTGSGAPQTVFVSLKNGMQQLVDTLLTRMQGEIRIVIGTAEKIEGAKGNYRIALNGDAIEADEVVLATPAYRAGELLRGRDEKLTELLESIPYHSAIIVALIYSRPEFDHPLNGFGFVVPRAEKQVLTACTWVNTKFPHRAAQNRALLRAFFGTHAADQMVSLPDEYVQTFAHNDLRRLMHYNATPIGSRVQRWDRTMPQYEVGHLARQQEIDERLRQQQGLWLTGNSYAGIGIPDCIHRSQQVATQINQS